MEVKWRGNGGKIEVNRGEMEAIHGGEWSPIEAIMEVKQRL